MDLIMYTIAILRCTVTGLHGDWKGTVSSLLPTAVTTVTTLPTIGSSVTVLSTFNNSDYTVTVQSPLVTVTSRRLME